MNHLLTEAEWCVMECLWDDGPKTGREVSDLLFERMGWNRSTSLTLLRRLEGKGAVKSSTADGIKEYASAIDRQEAAVTETENLLKRVYKGSVSLLVSSLTQKRSFSRKEIDELYAILKEMEDQQND